MCVLKFTSGSVNLPYYQSYVKISICVRVLPDVNVTTRNEITTLKPSHSFLKSRPD